MLTNHIERCIETIPGICCIAITAQKKMDTENTGQIAQSV